MQNIGSITLISLGYGGVSVSREAQIGVDMSKSILLGENLTHTYDDVHLLIFLFLWSTFRRE